MNNKTAIAVIGLSLILTGYGIQTVAKDESTQRSTVASSTPAVQKTSVRSSSGGSQGVAKVTWSGSSTGRSYQGGNGNYSHNYGGGYNRGYGGYHGYRGWGSYSPYWSIGSYFNYLPDDYTTYYVDGVPYYYCDGSYFSPYSVGYVVVPAPDVSNAATAQPMVQAGPEPGQQTIVEQPKSNSDGLITLNIPNSKGGFTPVKLTKVKGGYIGPQGEYYTGHPTMDELKVLYGD